VFYHITEGNFGSVRLDDTSVVEAASWPKAIHEGDGTMQIYISKNANEKQFNAIREIFHGRARGNGSFAIFARTCKYLLDPISAEIKYKIDGKRSSFSIPGVLNVELESFRNPVTGEESETELHLPAGFIFKVARACKTKVMRIVSPSLTFDDSGKNAFFCQKLEFTGP